MAKYLIKWKAGYGFDWEVVEAEDQGSAEIDARMAWLKEAESKSAYSAEILTRELAEEYGLVDELEDSQ